MRKAAMGADVHPSVIEAVSGALLKNDYSLVLIAIFVSN